MKLKSSELKTIWIASCFMTGMFFIVNSFSFGANIQVIFKATDKAPIIANFIWIGMGALVCWIAFYYSLKRVSELFKGSVHHGTPLLDRFKGLFNR